MLNLSYPRLLIVQIISDISNDFAQNLAKRLVGDVCPQSFKQNINANDRNTK